MITPITHQRLGALTGIILASAIGAVPARAYDLNSGGWPNGSVPMLVQLDTSSPPIIPSYGLLDGSSDWNAAATLAAADWNAHLTRSKLVISPGTGATATRGNGINEIVFSNDVYGEAFDSRTLGVTIRQVKGVFLPINTEADIIVNRKPTWNSFRGPLRASSNDIRRVLLHELGHVLGLDHPNEADPVQFVSAIMNAVINDNDSLQADDIAGAHALYDPIPPAPVITRNIVSQTVAVGERIDLAVELDGQDNPPETDLRKYAWAFKGPDNALDLLFTVHRTKFILGAAQLSDAGTYQLVVETPQGPLLSREVEIKVNPVDLAPATRLANLSTRGMAGTGEKALIVGFVISGTDSRQVLVRAIGATLAEPPFNLANALLNPSLTVFDANGKAVARNDDWQTPVGTAPADSATLQSAFDATGAFALKSGSADAALLATLPPGSYTAVIDGGDREGVAIVELYDTETTPGTRLVNLSTRGFVGTGGDIIIAGLNVRGSGPRTYLVRAAGNSLANFGVSGTLEDPLLTLFDGSGTYLRELDDWDSPAFLQPKLRSTMQNLGAFALTDRKDSVMLLTLTPGSYTLQVSGLEGETGVALVEVYELPIEP